MSAAKKDIKAFKPLLNDLRQRYFKDALIKLIIVSTNEQCLFLITDKKVEASYPISTAAAGLGNLSGSFKTPLGIHKIEQKIGEGAQLGSVFKGRKNTQTIAPILAKPDEQSATDNITSRILWLKGMEQGINLGGDVDSHDRYIYIHGTDEEGRLGSPVSHGCIRMANQDIIELYDKIEVGTVVYITEESIVN